MRVNVHEAKTHLSRLLQRVADDEEVTISRAGVPVAKLIAVRLEHRALRSRHFLHGHREPAPGVFDIAWFNPDGERVAEASWTDPEHRLLCLRRATRNGPRRGRSCSSRSART